MILIIILLKLRYASPFILKCHSLCSITFTVTVNNRPNTLLVEKCWMILYWTKKYLWIVHSWLPLWFSLTLFHWNWVHGNGNMTVNSDEGTNKYEWMNIADHWTFALFMLSTLKRLCPHSNTVKSEEVVRERKFHTTSCHSFITNICIKHPFPDRLLSLLSRETLHNVI